MSNVPSSLCENNIFFSIDLANQCYGDYIDQND